MHRKYKQIIYDKVHRNELSYKCIKLNKALFKQNNKNNIDKGNRAGECQNNGKNNMNNIITEEDKIDANGDGNDNNIDNKDTRALNENINNNKIRNHEIFYFRPKKPCTAFALFMKDNII